MHVSSDLQRLRGWEDVETELDEMRLEDQSEQAEGSLSVFSLLSQRSLRWQLISIIVLNMGQQLSGVNAVSVPTKAQPIHWHRVCILFDHYTVYSVCRLG